MKKQPQFHYKNNPAQSRYEPEQSQNYIGKPEYNNFLPFPRMQNFTKNPMSFGEQGEPQHFRKKESEQVLKPYETKIQVEYNKLQYVEPKIEYGALRGQKQKNTSSEPKLFGSKTFLRTSFDIMNQNLLTHQPENAKGAVQIEKRKLGLNLQQIETIKTENRVLKKENAEKLDVIADIKQKLLNLEYILHSKDQEIRKQKQKIQKDLNMNNSFAVENERLRKEMKIILVREKKLIDQKNQLLKKGQEKYKWVMEKNEMKLFYETKIEDLIKNGIQEKDNLIATIETLKKDKIQIQNKCSQLQKIQQEFEATKKLLQKNYMENLNQKDSQISNLKQEINIIQKSVINPEKDSYERIYKIQAEDMKKLQLQIGEYHNRLKNEQNKLCEIEGKNLTNQLHIKILQSQIKKLKEENQRLHTDLTKERTNSINDKENFIKKQKDYEEKIKLSNQSLVAAHAKNNHYKKNKVHETDQLEREKNKLLQEIKLLIEQKEGLLLNENINPSLTSKRSEELVQLKSQIVKKGDLINSLCTNIKNMEGQISKHHENNRNHRITEQLLIESNQKILCISLAHLNKKFSDKFSHSDF